MKYCSECNASMLKGYVIEGGFSYFCSDKCLYNNYTEEEWRELYGDGETDNYWTEWEIEELENESEKKERGLL